MNALTWNHSPVGIAGLMFAAKKYAIGTKIPQYLLLTFLNTEEGCDNENAHDCGSIYSNPPRIGHDCTYRNSLLLGTP